MASLEDRLNSLYRHLDEEGWHAHANTALLALENLRQLEEMKKSARLLLQQVEFAFEDIATPGWLLDCRKDIVG